MNIQMLQNAVAMAGQVGYVLVATADERGLPHLAAARKLSARQDARVAVGEWFCPGTVNNLQQNRRMAVVVWDPSSDRGFQLLGEVEQVADLAILDGYGRDVPAGPAIPQVERELLVRIDHILPFSHGPHLDVEE